MGTHPIFESDFDCLTDELMDVYLEIPPVTRVYVSACLLVNAAVQLGYVTPYQLYFNYDLILKSGELWRLFTNFLYFGPMGLHFLFHFLFLYRYSRNLEEGSFRGRNADFIFFFLFGMVLLSISALFVNIIFLGNALNLMFVYLWARRNPFIRMTFFGAVLALRLGRLFVGVGVADFGGRVGHYLWPHLLLFGGRFSKCRGWLPHFGHSLSPETAF